MSRRLRILETNYGRDAGWYLESEGRRLAVLSDCRYDDMFWDSYLLEPAADLATATEIFSDAFWSDPERLFFINRELLVAPTHVVLPAMSAARTLRETGRLVVRGLYLTSPEYFWDGLLVGVRRWWQARP